MADDGLLLNFEVGGTPVVSVSAGEYKGRWKEKAKAKKWDRIKARKAQNGRSVSLPVPHEEPKEAGTNGVVVNGSRMNGSEATNSVRPLKRKRSHASSANATPVIPRIGTSSLFTGNPEIAPTTKEVTVMDMAATNAPLSDFSAFTSLGLDPVIC